MNAKAPGWYPDPSNHLQERLWDGTKWVPFKVRPTYVDLTFEDTRHTVKPVDDSKVQPPNQPTGNTFTKNKTIIHTIFVHGTLLITVLLLFSAWGVYDLADADNKNAWGLNTRSYIAIAGAFALYFIRSRLPFNKNFTKIDKVSKHPNANGVYTKTRKSTWLLRAFVVGWCILRYKQVV